MEKERRMPTGELARSSVVGLTAAKVGIKEVEYFTKKLFKSETSHKALKASNDEDIAKIIFKSLSLLRGTALKVAQMLSMEVDILPEAIQKELSRSCYRAPPLNRALIRKTIVSRLGNAPEKLFKSFQSLPFAAASLGQVHAAEMKDSKKVAIKVQYPGIAGTIKSDIKLLRKILKMLPYKALDQKIADEIEARLLEEVDYVLEAERTRWFKQHLISKWIQIPATIDSISNGTILVTEKLEGLHLEEWLATNPSQAEKDHYGQLLADIFYHCFYNLNTIHADPNPGNYLFRKDMTLGILDFGSVKQIPAVSADKFKDIYHYITKKDLSGVKVLYEKMGFKLTKQSKLNDKTLDNTLNKWIDWFAKPMLVDKFDFRNNQKYLLEGYKIGQNMRFCFDKVNSDFIYLDRALFGLFRFLIRMGASVSLKIDRPYIL